MEAVGKHVKLFWNVYSDYAVLIAISLSYFVFDVLMLPFTRQFSLEDITISHPFALHEQVPTKYLGIICVFFPALVLYGFGKLRNNSLLFWKSLMGLLYSTMVCGLCVSLLKNAVGRPRPDFLARCQPFESTPKTGLVDVLSCSVPWSDKVLQDGFRSFPSGHTSFSFAGLGFLAIFLAGQLKMFRSKTSSWKVVVPLVPLSIASWIGLSRSQDYRHHKEDIAVGALFGFAIAYVVYRQLFPPLDHHNADILYVQAELDEGYTNVHSAGNSSATNAEQMV